MEKHGPSSVNEKLRQERLERGWSQQYVADQLGIAVVTYNRWERGKQQPTAYYSLKLSALFSKSVEALGLEREKGLAPALDEMQPETQRTHIAFSTSDAIGQQDKTRSSSLPFTSVTLDNSAPEQAYKVPSYFDLPKRGRILLPIFLCVFLIIAALALLFLHSPFSPSSSSQVNGHPQPSTVPADLAQIPKNLAIDDPLTGPRDDTQWQTGEDCSFKQNMYRMSSTNGVNYCLANEPSFKNIVYQIEMVLQQGPRAGIVFRANDPSLLYYFSITPHGQYEVDLIPPGTTPPKILLHGTSSTIVTGYNHTNTLTVEANNAQLRFWINNAFIGEAHDTTFAEGHIGVCVGDYANASDTTLVLASFRNAQVWLIS